MYRMETFIATANWALEKRAKPHQRMAGLHMNQHVRKRGREAAMSKSEPLKECKR